MHPDRRTFLRQAGLGTAALAAGAFARTAHADEASPLVQRVHHVPVPDFSASNRHAGVESLLFALAARGTRFYRAAAVHPLAAPDGLIGPDDTVLVKVNAQWKYRGCTSSDVVRGLVQRVLDHPDGFTGEVVIVENGQDRGSLNCDTQYGCDGGTNEVHANAENERHSFSWLVTELFRDARVGQRLFDPIRTRFVAAGDHVTEGFRRVGTTSYPCFNTPRGTRVEVKEGLWTGSGHDTSRLKLINVPVLKDHKDLNVTAVLKHVYGLFTTYDAGYDIHDPARAGRAMADFLTLVRPMALNVLDCTWVSHASLCGYPPSTTTRVDTLLGGLDPCALDAWAARHVLLPASGDPAHDPDRPGFFRTYLTAARDAINAAGGLAGKAVTIDDASMRVVHQDARAIQLHAARGPDRVRLWWAGGRPPWRIERDVAPTFPSPVVLADGLVTAEFDDVTASGSAVFYYRATGA